MTLTGFIGMTFCAGAIGIAGEICSPPMSPFGAGSIAGARMFQRTFGFKLGGSGIFLIGASGTRGGGALARRNAGLGAGAGTGALLRTGSGFSRRTTGAGRGCTCGLGNGTIAGLFCRISIGAGAGCSFFGLREGTTVVVKWSGKLYDSLGMRDMAYRWGSMFSDFRFSRQLKPSVEHEIAMF